VRKGTGNLAVFSNDVAKDSSPSRSATRMEAKAGGAGGRPQKKKGEGRRGNSETILTWSGKMRDTEGAVRT